MTEPSPSPDLAVGRRVEPAEGERGVDGLGHPEVDGAQRRHQRPDQLGHLVELRVLALRRGLVVGVERGLQRAGGQADLLGQLGGGLGTPRSPACRRR